MKVHVHGVPLTGMWVSVKGSHVKGWSTLLNSALMDQDCTYGYFSDETLFSRTNGVWFDGYHWQYKDVTAANTSWWPLNVKSDLVTSQLAKRTRTLNVLTTTVLRLSEKNLQKFRNSK